MLLGKYTIYMEKLHEVFNYDEESGLIKLKSDNSEIGSIIVNRSEVGEIYYIQTNCFYKGYKFQVISENKDSMLIYTSNIEVGIKLNMEFIERSVYHKWVKKSDIDKIVEDKTILDL